MRNALEVLVGFLKLGATGFGGPLALVAQMQREFVDKRGWIAPEEFQKAFALIKSMPGAVAFNSAVYLGRRRAGMPGAVAAATGLIGPSFVFVTLFAWSYPSLRDSVSFQGFLDGMQAGALALIIGALKPLTGRFFPRKEFWLLAFAGATVFYLDWIPEPLLIIGGGLLVVAWVGRDRLRRGGAGLFSAIAAMPAAAEPATFRELFWICFKAGAFVFGSGIAITPLLERDFVGRLGWVTHDAFMDALAIGQVTPGPVLLTTTFLGHQVLGIPGAIVATFSVFLMGFIHMTTWFPSALDYLASRKWIDDFMLGALAMVTGTIVVTVLILASDWTGRPVLYVITALALAASLRSKLPSWLIIVLCGFAGLVI